MDVARQLIAFGRLKLPQMPRRRRLLFRRKTTNRLRAIETGGRGRGGCRGRGSQDN